MSMLMEAFEHAIRINGEGVVVSATMCLGCEIRMSEEIRRMVGNEIIEGDIFFLCVLLIVRVHVYIYRE